ncbi:endoribonuclease [Citrobacter braakii]|nr:endoribonuclease [Citrobacter braakii]
MPTPLSKRQIRWRKLMRCWKKQGSSKSRILDATLFLADKNDFAAMNKAWDAWVVAGHAPVRCTVQAGLMNPKYKVEIKIIAAV